MAESVDVEACQQRLWGMFGVTFRCRVMDLQQEQLARSMGEGHRVIHGVAGSVSDETPGQICVEFNGTAASSATSCMRCEPKWTVAF